MYQRKSGVISLNPPGVVRVILGDPSDGMYGETCYYASDLGYPLTKELWSKHQIDWYQKCNEDAMLFDIAIGLSEAENQEQKKPAWQYIDIAKRVQSTSFPAAVRLELEGSVPTSICLTISYKQIVYDLIKAPLTAYLDLIKGIFKADKSAIIRDDCIVLIEAVDRIVIDVSFDDCPSFCLTQDDFGKSSKEEILRFVPGFKRRDYQIQLPVGTRSLNVGVSRLDDTKSEIELKDFHFALDSDVKSKN